MRLGTRLRLSAAQERLRDYPLIFCTRYAISLSLSFLTYQKGIIIVQTAQGCQRYSRLISEEG